MPCLLVHDPDRWHQELRSLVDLVLQPACLQNLSQAAGWVLGGGTISTIEIVHFALPKMEEHTMIIFDRPCQKLRITSLLDISSCPYVFHLITPLKHISSGAGPKSEHHRLPDLLGDSAAAHPHALQLMCKTYSKFLPEKTHRKNSWLYMFLLTITPDKNDKNIQKTS